jgi:hypothetical protein
VSKEYIKLSTFKKYQKTQKESSWDSNERSNQQKKESVKKNSSSLVNIFEPLKHVRNFADFCACRGWKVATSVNFVGP